MQSLVRTYLFLYNAFLAIGWSFVLGRLIYGVFDDSAWLSVHKYLKVVQTAAVAEVAHPVLGLVRTNVFSTVLQISSRLFLLWMVANQFYIVGDFFAFSTMAAAWCLAEIPRYLYFAVAQQQKPPYWLTWLRYSAFMVLYPIGVASELACLYGVLPIIFVERPYSISMPNKYNFALDTYYVSVGALLAYIPGLPLLYAHMLQQRRKQLAKYSVPMKRSEAAENKKLK
mmetsp:Transcript_2866/g.8750  ORF Transcript_2866/g.8750 Transcript_2866/m.8750 type:complete len:227 (+) Transcript_2866:166-846(+)